MKKDTVVDSLTTIVGFVMNYTRTRVRYMQRTTTENFCLGIKEVKSEEIGKGR